MKQIPVNINGPDYYCPDCGRWLAKLNSDGTFDLAGQAAVSLRGTVELEDLQKRSEIDATMMDATCLRCHPEGTGLRARLRTNMMRYREVLKRLAR